MLRAFFLAKPPQKVVLHLEILVPFRIGVHSVALQSKSAQFSLGGEKVLGSQKKNP